jgi:hypothetical protein
VVFPQQESSFDVRLQSTAKLASGSDAFRVSLKGQLQLRALPEQSGQRRVVGSFVEPKLVVAGSSPGLATPNEAKEIQTALQQPALVAIEGGRVVDTWFAPGTPPVAIGLYRTVLAAMQLSEAGDRRADAWSAEEYDSSGRYHASYRRTSADVVVRTKDRYVDLLTTGRAPTHPEKLLPKIETSNATITLVAGTLVQVQLREVMASQFEGNTAIQFQNELTVAALPSPAPRFAGFDERGFASSALHLLPQHPLPRDSNAQSNFDVLRTQGWKFDDLLKELEILSETPLVPSETGVQPGESEQVDPKSSAGSAVQERTRAFAAFVSFLRSQPDTVPIIEARIRAGTPAGRTLVDGLAAAESGDAQQALVRLMQDKDVEKSVRMRAATGLARVDHPEPTGVRAMFGMLDDPVVADQAVLGIGSMGRRLREQRDLQLEIANTLRKVLQAAATLPKRLEALRAISNSGNEQLLADVRPFLAASEATVRARAVESMRHMQAVEVEGTLVDVLRGDPAADVQVAVLQACQTRGYSTALSVGVAQALAHSEYEDVRQRAITLARAWQEREPSLRAALQRAARDDKDPEIRAAAAAALK